MKQTILHEKHLSLNARMTDFQGWQVPLQYPGVLDEYHAVRSAAGLFDVSYLGRIEVSGSGAVDLLQRLFTRDVDALPAGIAEFGLFCSEAGMILDDAVLFHLPKNKRFMVCTNALNTEKIIQWLRKNGSGDVVIEDRTLSLAQIAIHGPRSGAIIEKTMGGHLKKIKHRGMREVTMAGADVLVSHSGYTGEQGYELFIPASHATLLWESLLESGAVPCGLGSRDILRLEMGYPLYGNEIHEKHSPVESRLMPVVDMKKDFVGKDAIAKIAAAGVPRKLAGFMLLDKGIPKTGGFIFSENREVGVVTSAGHSPHVRSGIGLGYVFTRYVHPGQEIEIEVRDREVAARIVDLPFYRKK